MRRKLNVKLAAIVLGALVVVSGAVHFLHGYQVGRNAYRLRERGDRAVEEKQDAKALTYYAQYLSLVPNDVDVVQKYAEVLDRNVATDAEHLRLVLMMEQVLRAKPNEDALRLRLVHNLIALDRIAEAIDNLAKLKESSQDKAEVLHMIGWCQDAKKDYAQAAASFEEAIRANPKQIKSYALLAEVLQDRLHQPDEAAKALDDLVRANSDSYQAYLIRARFQRRRGDEKAAQGDLHNALQLGPDKAEVILEVADAARARGDWAEAVKLLQDGMKRYPDQAEFVKAMVSVKILTELRAEAVSHLKDSLKGSSKSLELTILLIDLLIDQKQYAEARTRIDDLKNTDVRPAFTNYLKARLAIADQQWHDAIKLLEGVRVDLGAGSDWSSRVNVLLGMCFRATGDHDQELQAFRRAVRDEPTWMAANVGLGASLLSNGQIEEACRALEPLATAKDVPAGYWTLLSRARLYRQLRLPESERRWEVVEESVTQAIKADPKGVEAPTIRAEVLAAKGDIAAARVVLEKLRTEHPTDVTLACALAELSARQNRFDEAEKILEQAGDKVETRLAKCRLWAWRGTKEDRVKLATLADMPQATFSADQRVRVWRELADTWHRLGDAARAEAIWRDLARALPRDLRSRSALLDLALQRNQPPRAWIDEIRAIEGEQGWIWRYGDAAHLVQDARGRPANFEAARKRLQEIDAIHKNWARAAVLSATIHALEGNDMKAADEYIRALELGETEPRVLARLLGLLIEHREFSKAETELAKYQQKQPLTKDLARLGAEVALGMREKHYARVAVKRAEQAVGLEPSNYPDALWLARIYSAAEDDTKAETLLLRSLEQAGHTPDAWIAWMEFLHRTHQRDRGLKDLERLKKELAPGRQPLTLARCFEALHLPDQAAKAYADALRQAPDDFIALARAADFQRRAERTDEARKLYDRLLDPDVGAPEASRVDARRELAILLAESAPSEALALLGENTATHGDAIADRRIRLFIQSLTPSARADALAKFEDSLRQRPASPDDRLLLARILESAGKLSQARTQLVELVEEHPNMPYYLVRCARVLIRLDETAEAERLVARLETLEPTSDRVRSLRAALGGAPKK